MLKKIKQRTIGIKLYSKEYWDKVQEIVYSKENEYGKFIINYFLNVKKENVLEDDSKICLFMLSSLYPIKENEINRLTKGLTNLINKLNQIERKELIDNRDQMLYQLMDILFHNPELICDIENEIEDSLLDSIIKMSELYYDQNKTKSESYFKNYKVIQFIDYFKNQPKKIILIDKYLNHFDLQLKEDIIFEFDEYGKFDYYKK